MTSAVIVSTARTPWPRAGRALQFDHGATLGGHAVEHAIKRAGIDAGEVDDVLMGCATPEGATGANIARQIALMAGCPVTTSGVTVNRFCSSGLQTIAMAAQRIIANEGDIYVAGGVEAISCVQQEMNQHMLTRTTPWSRTSPRFTGTCCKPPRTWPSATTLAVKPWMSTVLPASKGCRCTGCRPVQDEIAPITVTMGVADKVMGLMTKQVTVSDDEGIRAPAPRTTASRACALPSLVVWSPPVTPASSPTAAVPWW